jgi:hypothetical protein
LEESLILGVPDFRRTPKFLLESGKITKAARFDESSAQIAIHRIEVS